MVKIGFVVGVVWILCTGGCVHKASAGRLVRVSDAHDTITHAQSFYNAGEIDAAIAMLHNFVDSKAYDPSHDKAYELIVDWLLQLNRRAQAKGIASYFLANHQASHSAQKIIDLFDESLQHLPLAPPDKSLEQMPEQPIMDEALEIVSANGDENK